jgi:hypothetical protein
VIPIRIASEYLPPPNAPHHNMVHRIRNVDSRSPRHDPSIPRP